MQNGDAPQIYINLLPSSEPDWVSVTLGVFVCQGCSLIHRSIENFSQVKSVLQDTFEDKEIEVSHRRSTGRVFLAEGCLLLQGWMYCRNQLFLISWIPSKSAVISRATEIDWLFAYLKDWGCKPLELNISLGIQRELMFVIIWTEPSNRWIMKRCTSKWSIKLKSAYEPFSQTVITHFKC